MIQRNSTGPPLFTRCFSARFCGRSVTSSCAPEYTADSYCKAQAACSTASRACWHHLLSPSSPCSVAAAFVNNRFRRAALVRGTEMIFVTMRVATPLGFKRLQCRAWELSNANLEAACKVVFSNRLLVSDAISPPAYKASHAAQVGVHKVVQRKARLPEAYIVPLCQWNIRSLEGHVAFRIYEHAYLLLVPILSFFGRRP